jgi:hypothetical protein
MRHDPPDVRRLREEFELICRSAVQTTIDPTSVTPLSRKPNRLPAYVFHLAEEANFSSIQQYGLLSASALLDLAGIKGQERIGLEACQRPVHTKLPNGICLRDQKPMPPQALARCVIGMQPAHWYRLINSKVFFWLEPDRLNRQRQACETRPQIVLVIDAKRLLDRYGDKASVSPINTGNARRKPASRGQSTFVPYASWSASGWESEATSLGTRTRPHSHQPVELTIDGGVADIMDVVIQVQRLEPGEPFGHWGYERPDRHLP